MAVNFIRFSDFGASRHTSPRANVQRPGGLLGIEEATAAVDKMRLLSEKAMFQISRMQLIASLQFELALAHLVAQPETQRALDTSARLLDASDRLSLAVEQLPVRAQEMLYPAIADIDRRIERNRQAAIDQLMERMAAERQAIVRDLTSEEERLRNFLGDAREVLTIGKDLASQIDSTVTKVDTLAVRFGPGPAKAGEAPFHIEDYRAAARELSGAAENLRGLVVSINQLLASPAWDRRLAASDGDRRTAGIRGRQESESRLPAQHWVDTGFFSGNARLSVRIREARRIESHKPPHSLTSMTRKSSCGSPCRT